MEATTIIQTDAWRGNSGLRTGVLPAHLTVNHAKNYQFIDLISNSHMNNNMMAISLV